MTRLTALLLLKFKSTDCEVPLNEIVFGQDHDWGRLQRAANSIDTAWRHIHSIMPSEVLNEPHPKIDRIACPVLGKAKQITFVFLCVPPLIPIDFSAAIN